MSDQPIAAAPEQVMQSSIQSPIEAAAQQMEENLVDGLTFELLDDRHVLALTMQNVTEQTILAWGACTMSTQGDWPEDEILYLMNEFPGFSGKHMNTAMTQARAVAKSSKHIQYYLALVVPNNIGGQVADLAIRAASFAKSRQRMQIFFKRSDALRWLHTCRLLEEKKASGK